MQSPWDLPIKMILLVSTFGGGAGAGGGGGGGGDVHVRVCVCVYTCVCMCLYCTSEDEPRASYMLGEAFYH